MSSLFGRHRVRNTFYFLVTFLYIIVMWAWWAGIISDAVSTALGFFLFITDLVAHLYDPCPRKPGPWFKRHFHRLLDGEEYNDL